MRYARDPAPPLRPCAQSAWGGADCVAPGGHYPEQSSALGQVTLGVAGGRGWGEGSGRDEGREGGRREKGGVGGRGRGRGGSGSRDSAWRRWRQPGGAAGAEAALVSVGGGGGRGTPTPPPRDAKEKAGWGWGRDLAPTPGRGDEGSMGAKESRIGFLSYEEALRRGEGGGVWASCLGGQRWAAQRVGDRERGEEVEGVGRLRRKGKEASVGEYYGGEGSGGSSVEELGPYGRGRSFPGEKGIWRWQGSACALWWRCYPVCGQGSPFLLFLGGTSLSSPPYRLLPFSHITP